MKYPRSSFFVITALLCVMAVQSPAFGQKVDQPGQSIQIRLDGQHFTTLELKKYRRPVLYPIYGPGQAPMTRNHPMKAGTEGEATDHPHHKSIWCAHGLINGTSFWHEQGEIKVDESKPVSVGVGDDKQVHVEFHSKYFDENGELVCTDSNEMVFQTLEGGARAIDWNISIHASEGELTFGDTKEGMMAIRTHPSLRIDKGATAVNSSGVEGKAIWGKRATWVDYSGAVEGKQVGVSIFDHPSNLRHPTTWHARSYGLVAANPFGLHHFEGKKLGTGDHKVAKGDSIHWKYRFVFHEGDAESAHVAERYEAFAKH